MNISKTKFTIIWQLVVILLLGGVVYSNALTGAFQFDDKITIVENATIKSLSALWPPVDNRWLGLLTFALNYQIGGLDTFGYHLVNVLIHLLAALAVYTLVTLTQRTPYFTGIENKSPISAWLPFACALLFVSHPLQTQAVTYIVQRFASLAALFFLLSLICYVSARLKGGWQFCWYGGAGILAIAALATKENTVVLPLVALLYDLFFICGFSGAAAYWRQRRRWLAGGAVLLLSITAMLHAKHDLLRVWDKLRATNDISRHDYLMTQFRVIVTYLRLLFVPTGQTLDHFIPVYSTLSAPTVAASLALIVLLVALACWLTVLTSRQTSLLRLVPFGIFWFFVTLSIESGVIPIIDVMFEHRLYLPGLGIMLAVAASVLYGWDRCGYGKRFRSTPLVILLVAIVTLFSYATWQRNKVWQNEITLWSDVIAKKPDNPRGYNMVGSYYLTRVRPFEALPYFRKALAVDPAYAEARSNLGSALIQSGQLDEGLNELLITARTNRFDEVDMGILYYLIGKAFYAKGMFDKAVQSLDQSLYYAPKSLATYSLRLEVARQRDLIAGSGK
jgi:hypothetical protein